MKPVILTVMLLVLAGSVVHTDPDQHTTLIIPIYNQTRDYLSGVSMIETQGRRVKMTTEEFTENGELVNRNEWLILEENSIEYLAPFFDIAGNTPEVGSGWARIFVPKNRQVHAVYGAGHHRERGRSVSFIASPPARVFRFVGSYDRRPHPSKNDANHDTGLSIVNPTDTEQTVRVTFHRTYPRDSDGEPPTIPRTIQGTVKIPAMHRVSRFLTELVPIQEKFPGEHVLSGVIRVEGETEISAAALYYFWNIPFMGGIHVTAEPVPQMSPQ